MGFSTVECVGELAPRDGRGPGHPRVFQVASEYGVADDRERRDSRAWSFRKVSEQAERWMGSLLFSVDRYLWNARPTTRPPMTASWRLTFR